MSTLRRLALPAMERLSGYLSAAQFAFIGSNLDVTLTAAGFEILDPKVTDRDVIDAGYSGVALIKRLRDCSVEEMMTEVHETMTVHREMWSAEYCNIPNILERELRDGYWAHVKECVDHVTARIVEVEREPNFDYVFSGFAYLLYGADMRRCLLLVGNASD